MLAAGLFAAEGCSKAPGDPSLQKADSIVEAWVASERVSGAVLLVRRQGETVLHQAHGWAQLYEYGTGQYERPDGIRRMDSPVPMSPGTVFDLASVTKVMATTMALMLLVDEEVVDLDAPVVTYLPDFTGDGRDAITVRHLLTHTSGLPQWLPTYYHASAAPAAYEYLRTVPLEWPVGAERRYSDLGFMLLGRIVQEVSGESLDSLVRRRIYRPLGLTATGFRPVESTPASDSHATDGAGESGDYAATSHGNPFERRMVTDPDFGYRIDVDPSAWNGWRTRTLRGEVNDGNAFHAFGGVAGHAGLFAEARELGVLLQLLLDRGNHPGGQLFREETVGTFLEPAIEGQALGWQLPAYAPAGSFGHTGFTGTFVLGVPRDSLAVVLLTNRQNVGVDAETRYPDVGPLQSAVTEALTGSAGR
ncbi:MAG: serine hydrolase [Longimicrobiales bacterium]|nr:serine hydrolase [Longimicrobiales bacterium]